MRTEFNDDYSPGEIQDKLNPTLKFIVGLARLSQMRPWQWVSYFTDM